MRNICLVIEYDGTNYCGWQIQKPRFKTIQDTVRKVLRRILQEEILVIGASRTDAGVHAKHQAVNFKTNSKLPLERIRDALNSLLPQDIVIRRIKEVGPEFHTQFCAKEKTYRYTILNRGHGDALLNRFVSLVRYNLDSDRMRSEAKVLLGRHDFSAFQGAARIAKSAVRNIKKITVAKKGSFIFIEITADGFLNNMVRNIVGTLIEIGRGRFAAGSMKRILASKNRGLAGPTAAAKGLCLISVKY